MSRRSPIRLLRHLGPPLAAVLLLAACAGARTAGPVPDATAGYVVTPDSARLHYRALGRGGDTLVVVHGFQGHGSSYLAADLLPLAKDRVVIFFDQRGDGLSTAATDTAQLGIEQRVRDLEAVRRWFGLERMALLGHSGGAAVAMRYAVEHPDRVSRLVMVAPPPPVRDPFATQVASRFAARLDSMSWARARALTEPATWQRDPVQACRRLAAILLPRAYFADSARARRMRGDFCGSPAERLATQPARTAAFLRSLPADWRNDVRTVRVPTLVVAGDHDAIPVAAAQAWVDALPDARLVVVRDADHLPWVEQPAAFFPSVDRFLRGMTAEPPD